MKKQLINSIIWGIVFVLLISACGAEASPTPDASAIATSAVQTVEARYTEQAALQTPEPTANLTVETPEPVVTLEPTPTTVIVSQGGGSDAACYFAQFVSETVPDGTIFQPGTTFTKTWQIKNVGTCAWDTSHRLYLQSGDGLTTLTTVALLRTIYPGEIINLVVEMTAPASEGVYTGYWRIATPYGGSFGVGAADASLISKITVAKDPLAAFAVTSVYYSLAREPKTGCTNGGATYTITATVATNGPGEVRYTWYQHPYDGGIRERGRLNFSQAGSQTISWVWNLKADVVQDPGFERKVSLFIEAPNNQEFQEGWIPFYHTCP